MIERFFQSANYGHRYRHEIDDGRRLADDIDRYLMIYNALRPHEAFDFARPLDRYLARRAAAATGS